MILFIEELRIIICEFLVLRELFALTLTNSNLSKLLSELDLSRYIESLIKHRKSQLIKTPPTYSHLFYSFKWNYWQYSLRILEQETNKTVPIIIDCLKLSSLGDNTILIISQLLEKYKIARSTIVAIYKISLQRGLVQGIINSFIAIYNMNRSDLLLLMTIKLEDNFIYSKIPTIDYDLLERFLEECLLQKIYELLQYEYIRKIALSSNKFRSEFPFHYRAAIKGMRSHSFNTLLC